MEEVFNQKRMDRCAKIQRAIMINWQKNNKFDYTVRATQAVSGMLLEDFRKQYFIVGVGNDLTELPFTDMLVIFSMIEQETNALKQRKPIKGEKEFKVKFQISTFFSDEEAARLLSSIRIETPFDKMPYMRIRQVREPVDPDLPSDLE